MSEHHPQEALLIRYLDDQLSPSEREQAEQLIASDKSAATLVNTLGKSRLPLLQGLDPTLPPANQKMVDLINEWQPQAHANRTTRQFGIKTIAATLAFGVVTGHLLTTIVSKQESGVATQAVVAENEATPEWIRLVADYHRLYTRETVASAPAQDVSAVTNSVSTWLARDTSIPDLSDTGTTFSRAQQLAVDNDVLVQLAYLPENDKPVAVCIRKTQSAKNTGISYDNYEGMQYAEWQDGNHAVVIVGDIPARQLEKIAATVKSTLFKNT